MLLGTSLFVAGIAAVFVATGALAGTLGAVLLLSLIHISEPTRPY